MHNRFLPGTHFAAALAALTLGTATFAVAWGAEEGHGISRIMPLVVPGRTAQVPSRAHLDYFGGRVVSSVQVVQVLWGAGLYAPFVESTAAGSLPAFFAALTDSPYLDALAQYATDRPGVNGTPGTNQRIGRGSFFRQVRIAPGRGAIVSDAEIVAELSRQIRVGGLPSPSADPAGNANTVYMVHFPAGKTITVGGGTSCATFCAYHGAFSLDGKNVYYAVMPDMSAGSGCDLGCGAGAPFENATSVASHELAEVITDPEVSLAAGFTAPLAWYDTFNGEAGDICNGIAQPLTLGDGARYTVQQFWSNADEACSAGGGALTPPALAAATSVQQPAAASVQQPAAASVQQPAAASVQQLAAASVEQPAAASVEQPAAASVEQPAAASVEQPAAASVEQPAAASVEQPAAASVEQPPAASVEEPAAASVEQPAAASVEQPAAASVEQPAAASVEQPAAAAVLVHAVAPVPDGQAAREDVVAPATEPAADDAIGPASDPEPSSDAGDE